MTDEQFQILMEALIENNALQQQMVELLTSADRKAPNYQLDLEKYPEAERQR